MNQYDYSNLATDAALSRIERETCNRKNESASHRWYTSVLPIPTAASMTISKTPDDTAALR